MDFTLTPEINDMCRRIRSFVDEHLLPIESDPTIYDEYESIRKELLDALRIKQKPQVFGHCLCQKNVVVLGIIRSAWQLVTKK